MRKSRFGKGFMLLFLIIFPLLGFNGAALGAVDRVYTPPEGWQLNTPPENVFKVQGSEKEFILLDATSDDDSRFLVLAKEDYGLRAYDPDSTQKFDVADANNLAYWLNHDFIASSNGTGKQLPQGILAHIDDQHVWPTEGGYAAGNCPEDYTVTAGIVVLSQTEWLQYTGKFGVKDKIASSWWLRTGRGINGSANRVLVVATDAASQGQTQVSDPKGGGSGPLVRPAFYLNKSFMTDVKLDIASLGENVKAAMRNTYTWDELRSGNAAYSASELITIGFTPPAGEADTQAPTWPQGSSMWASEITRDSAAVTWTPAADENGVAGYKLYLNGSVAQAVYTSQVDSVHGSVYRSDLAGLNSNTSYTVKVEALDPAGNITADGPQAQFRTRFSEGKLAPSADSFVRGGTYGNERYGTAVDLIVKTDAPDMTRETFLQFDLSGLDGEVGSAVLYLYGAHTDASGTEINNTLFGVEDDNWSEDSLFWNNKPGMDGYLGTLHMNKTMEWKSVDVTSFVRQQTAKDQKASFGIAQLETPGRATTYKSREHAVNYPYLLISRDRANPAAPVWSTGSNVAVTDAGENEIALAWTPAVADGGITYRIMKNGQMLDEVSGLTYTARNLDIDAKYTFKIEARDSAGNMTTDGPMVTAKTANTSLVQVRLGNIFLENEPVQVKMLSGRDSFRWAAYDVWGRKAQEGSGTVADGTATITIPVADKGYYDLEVYAEAPGKADVKLETSFALLSEYDFTQIEDSFFGMCTHLTSTYKGWGAHLVELINRAGAKNIRDEMHWDKIEKSKGVYTFSDDMEAYMQAIKERKINPFIILSFTNPFYDNNSTPYTDEGRLAFANYGKAILDKYGDQINWVEVYNEFNHTYGDRGDGPADSLPSYYYELVKKTYEVVKASYPEVTVVGPTSAGIDVPWLNELFGLGALPYMDAVSVHHYGYPISPEVHYNEKLDQLIQLIKQHNNGELKSIWLTEFGYPTHNQGTGIDEKGQSDNLVKGHVIAMSKGVEKGFWYDFMNDGLDVTYNENNFGIIRNEKDPKGAYVPKPAYAAYAAMTRQLTGASFVEKENRDSALYSYKFTRNQEELRVLWTLAPENVTIKAAGPLEITDYMGNTATYVPVNGEIYMTLSEEPIYVKGAVQDIVKGGILSLSADAPILGDPVSVLVSVQNTTDASLQVAVEVNGVAGAYTALARQQAVKEILLPAMEETGTLNIVAYVKLDGKLAGKAQISTTVGKSYEIKTRPHIRNVETGEAEILVEVVNRAKQSSLAMSGVEWSMGAKTGMIPLAEPIAPDSKHTFAIPVGKVNFWTSYPVSITSEVNGAALAIYTGQLDFSPVVKQTVDFEADVDEADLGIDLLTGTVQIPPAAYTGPEDLSGKIGLHWDEDKLYILAKIVDDTHFYSGQGSDIWRYDSIQFTLSAGVPGESSQWYEYGMAQTPAGPQIYRWRAPAGISTGNVANGELRVTRIEESKYTLYQLALPWEELTPIRPDKESVISISFAVNDNDGAAREGYVEWGAGIAGSKDPSKFRSAEFRDGAAPEEPGEEPGEPGGEPGSEPGESDPVPANPSPAPGTQAPGAALPDDKKVSLIQLDQGKVLEAVKEDKDGSRVISIQVPETEPAVIRIQLPLAALKNLDEVATVSIVAGEISSNIPLQALTAGAMEALLGEDAGNASLQLSIERLAGDKEKAMKDKVARTGLTLVGNPVEFGVKVIAGVKETELSNLGAAYAMRSLTLNTGTADGKANVVRYNPRTDSFEFVPAATQRVDGSTQIITKSTQNGIFMIVSSRKSFEDVKEHWAKEEVEALASKLLVNGVSDQSFNPEGRMTRAEITALLVRALTLDALFAENRFSDIKDTDWFAGAVGAAAKSGLINGYEDDTFKPDGYVTREEAVLLMVRAIEIAGGALEEAGDSSLPGFTDGEAVSSWAEKAVSRMVNAELINGMTASTFAPQENITRAQAAAMLSRVLRYVGFID